MHWALSSRARVLSTCGSMISDVLKGEEGHKYKYRQTGRQTDRLMYLLLFFFLNFMFGGEHGVRLTLNLVDS